MPCGAAIHLHPQKGSITKAELKTLTILLNPFAPHVTEEMWDVMGFGGMANEAQWPE